MREYHKIYPPFKRAIDGPNRGRLIIGNWFKPEFGFLADTKWIWTEKIDGTNARIHWNGHKVTFGGRTDDAQMPVRMLEFLVEKFTEELFEQAFGDSVVTLYGEGVGKNVQRGTYTESIDFILFDVLVGDWWLERHNIESVARKMGAKVVPLVSVMTLNQMIDHAIAGPGRSIFGDFDREGVVGTPLIPLFNRAGERIIVKVKEGDFRHLRGGPA